MKKIKFLLPFILLMGLIYPTFGSTKAVEPTYAYTIDLGTITNDSDVEEAIESFFKNVVIPDTNVLNCSVTVAGTVDAQVTKFKISVTVSGPCDEIAKSGQEIAKQLLKQVAE